MDAKRQNVANTSSSTSVDAIIQQASDVTNAMQATAGTAFANEIQKMNIEQVEKIIEFYENSSSISERFVKDLCPLFMPIVSTLDTQIQHMIEIKESLHVAFEMSYTTEFFHTNKFIHQSFYDLLSARHKECLNELEIARQVNERMTTMASDARMSE